MKILCVRIGRTGDIIMALPALTHIRSTYPHATIDVITSQNGKHVIPHSNTNIRHFIVHNDLLLYRYLHYIKTRWHLNKTCYDHIYILETKKRYQRWFTHKRSRVTCIKPSTTQHSTDSHLEQLGMSCKQRKLWRQRPLLNICRRSQKQLLQSLSQHGVTEHTMLIAFHPSYSGVHKNKHDRHHKLWPLSHWSMLAEILLKHAANENKDIQIIADFLPSEQGIADQLKQSCGEKVLILSSSADFKRYLALMARTDILVAPNTGSMHTAAAVNARVVALFSGESPITCAPFAPTTEHTILDADALSEKTGGLERISPQHVLAAIVKLSQQPVIEPPQSFEH